MNTPANQPSKPRLSPPRIRNVRELRQFQSVMAEALFRPLTAGDKLRPRWSDGRATKSVVAEFVKPNSKLTSMERLEIYAKSYWFRVLDCLYEDYPGVRAILGDRRFSKLATAFLAQCPSESFTLRNLGARLAAFIEEHPEFVGRQRRLVVDMARLEWAQVVAFDGPALPPLLPDDVLDAGPTRLRVSLQPYITLLECEYPVDDFTLALKNRDTAALRTEASNAVTERPGSRAGVRRRLPRPAKTFLAVHRQDNMIFFKRLEPEAYALLRALSEGKTLTAACAAALREAGTGVDWSERVREWFEMWQSLGWFSRRAKRGGA